jgi:multisubunit Na+/H+ antiporter MnhE subunit
MLKAWMRESGSTGLSLPRRTRPTIHVLDLQDEESWIPFIKQRYERRLMEIFE